MIVWFTGDPIGYTVHPEDGPEVWDRPDLTKWLVAHVGNTTERVRIDVSKAYRIDAT